MFCNMLFNTIFHRNTSILVNLGCFQFPLLKTVVQCLYMHVYLYITDSKKQNYGIEE